MATKRKAKDADDIKVAMWVVVQYKRIKKNELLQDVPAVVASVDKEANTANLLFPNKLSMYFVEKGLVASNILFATETHDLNKVRLWSGSLAEQDRLNKVLVSALLHFAEGKGKARRAHKDLHVTETDKPESIVLDGKGTMISGYDTQMKQIKVGLKQVVAETLEIRGAKAPEVDVQAITLPGAPASSPCMEGQKEFSAMLASMFDKSGGLLPLEAIRDDLVPKFGDVHAMLSHMVALCKVFIVEDVAVKLE